MFADIFFKYIYSLLEAKTAPRDKHVNTII